MTILKRFKGLELIQLNESINGKLYDVRYKKERKAKLCNSLDDAIECFYNCIK